jgi:hypothetical protein
MLSTTKEANFFKGGNRCCDPTNLQSFVLVIFCSLTFLFDSKTATRLPCYPPPHPPGGKSGIWLFCYVQMFAVEELPLKQVVFINVTIGL